MLLCLLEKSVYTCFKISLLLPYTEMVVEKVNTNRKLLIKIVNTQEYLINYEQLYQVIWTYTSNIWVLKGFYKVSHFFLVFQDTVSLWKVSHFWGRVQSEMVVSQEHYGWNHLDCIDRMKSALILERVLSWLVWGQCLLTLQLGLPKLRILLLYFTRQLWKFHQLKTGTELVK